MQTPRNVDRDHEFCARVELQGGEQTNQAIDSIQQLAGKRRAHERRETTDNASTEIGRDTAIGVATTAAGTRTSSTGADRCCLALRRFGKTRVGWRKVTAESGHGTLQPAREQGGVDA